MNKYRPEENKITCPVHVGDKFEKWLKENLHSRARLTRKDTPGKTIFKFWPTKSEYFYISMLIRWKGEEFLDSKIIEERDKP